MEWPHRVSNFSVFKDSLELIGVSDITLPDMVAIEDAIKGAGIMGEISPPTACHLSSMEMVLNWIVPDDTTMELAMGDGVDLDCYVCHQTRDTSTNRNRYKGWRFFVRGAPKGLNLGTVEVAAPGAASTTLEVYRIRGLYEDVEQMEIDKENFIYRIKGVDYAAEIRRKIGRAV